LVNYENSFKNLSTLGYAKVFNANLNGSYTKLVPSETNQLSTYELNGSNFISVHVISSFLNPNLKQLFSVELSIEVTISIFKPSI